MLQIPTRPSLFYISPSKCSFKIGAIQKLTADYSNDFSIR